MSKLYALFSSESNQMHSSIDNDINTTDSTPVMSVVEKIISVIAPFRCLRCGNDGKLVCDTCVVGIFDDFSTICGLCSGPTTNYQICSTCLNDCSLEHIFAVSKYQGLSKDLVKEVKFERAKSGAKEISKLLDQYLPVINWDLVTFVPTATKRVRQRGYDHAELIAKNFAYRRKLPFEKAFIRVNQQRQVGSTRKIRIQQLEDAFIASRKYQNKHILIIDDVMSTGASLKTTSKVLNQAGANKIDGAVFAKN